MSNIARRPERLVSKTNACTKLEVPQLLTHAAKTVDNLIYRGTLGGIVLDHIQHQWLYELEALVFLK